MQTPKTLHTMPLELFDEIVKVCTLADMLTLEIALRSNKDAFHLGQRVRNWFESIALHPDGGKTTFIKAAISHDARVMQVMLDDYNVPIGTTVGDVLHHIEELDPVLFEEVDSLKYATPLFLSCGVDWGIGGSKDCVELLLHRGADSETFFWIDYDQSGFFWEATPLCAALENPMVGLDVIMMLLENGANCGEVNAVDSATALHFAAMRDNDDVEYIINILLSYPSAAPINTVDDEGRTALWVALQSGSRAAVKALIQNGADTQLAFKHGLKQIYLDSEEWKLILKTAAEVEAEVKAEEYKRRHPQVHMAIGSVVPKVAVQ
jgi:hypothetical protein